MAELSWTHRLADNLGCAEPGLRLVLGQLFGYPICYVHHLMLKKAPALVQHLYFILTGVCVALFSIGVDALFHGLICILLTFLVTRLCRGSLASTIFLFVAQLGYLVIGYYLMAVDTYDISWTMPHCVLTLRLIGLAMDVHDGQKKAEDLSKDQKEAALQDLPGIVEMLSHCFFIGGYLVGPQFSLRKYRAFIQRNITEDLPSPVLQGFTRLAIGLIYLLGFIGGSIFVPENFVESIEFLEMPYGLKKCFFFSLWAKVNLSKYISLWLMAEGCVILTGLAYNGLHADGQVKWNGGANVKLRVFENASRFQHMIDSFNINTNAWVLSYIYKRLKFLNNRLISQAGVLLFLSIWHGLHSGYYVAFFCEFLMINFEKDFFPMVDKSVWLQPLLERYAWFRALIWVVGKIYFLFFIPNSFLPFVLLKSSRYIPVMLNMKCAIFVFFGTWPIWRPLAKIVLQPAKPRQE